MTYNHLGPREVQNTEVKREESSQIQRDIDAFLARGGKIQVLGTTKLEPRFAEHFSKKTESKRPTRKVRPERNSKRHADKSAGADYEELG